MIVHQYFCPKFCSTKVCIALKHAFTFRRQKIWNKNNGMLFFPLRYCCHSVAILYFIAHMPHCCFIEFPDYSLTVSKCFIHVQYKYISLLCCIFFLSLSDSLLRLIACVTQLNLITFVGLAEWIAEMNNYRFNTEKYYQKFNWTMNWSNRQKQTHTHTKRVTITIRTHSGSICIWFSHDQSENPFLSFYAFIM